MIRKKRMMDKNQKEKQILCEWGKENSQKYSFLKADKKKDSYFIKRQDSAYIREYSFETLPQLREMLDFLWHGDEAIESIKMAVAVAAMKNKTINTIVKTDNGERKSELDDELPEYIYNF